MKQVIKSTSNFVEGYNGAGTFAFQGKSPKGNTVIMEVKPEIVQKLTEFLKFTDSVGHAAWHLLSPETPLPCQMCHKEEGAK